MFVNWGGGRRGGGGGRGGGGRGGGENLKWFPNEYKSSNFVIVLPSIRYITCITSGPDWPAWLSVLFIQRGLNISRTMKLCLKNFSGYVSLMPDFEFRLRNEQANVGF